MSVYPSSIPASKKTRLGIGKLVLRIFLVVQTLIVVYPLLWNVIASLKTNTEVMESPWSLPSSLNFDNYVRAFTTVRIGDEVDHNVGPFTGAQQQRF